MIDRILVWQFPKANPLDIAKDYGARLAQVEGIYGSWVRMQGGLLSFVTYIKDDRRVEQAVHDAELEILSAWPDVPIEFRIIREGDLAPEALKRLDLEGVRLL